MQHHTSALATIVSLLSAAITISTIQPIVSLTAGIVAIISGIFAIRYYHKSTQQLNKNKNENP